MVRRLLLFPVVLALLVAGCSQDETDSHATVDTPVTTTAEEAPFHAVPDDAVAVWGTAVCDSSDEGVNPEGGAGWLFTCELDMSDPRVSGTETHDRFRFIVGRIGAGTVWVAEEATIINAEGTWRGSAQGAEDDEMIPIGEAHYVGEGAYEGLEFHYYFFDSPLHDSTQTHGWISGGE